MRRVRTAAAAALLVLLGSSAGPATAAFQETTAATLVFERTTTGPASLQLFAPNFFGARPTDPSDGESVLGLVGVRAGVERQVVPLGQGSGSGDASPAVYAGGARVGCPTNGCGAIGTVGFSGRILELEDDGVADPRALQQVYVVQDNDDPWCSTKRAGGGWSSAPCPSGT